MSCSDYPKVRAYGRGLSSRSVRDLVLRVANKVHLAPRASLLDQRPPPAPAGWSTAPPDFVGVGVQKAGTSWWYSLIAVHPNVYRDRHLHKEVHYFDRFWRGCFEQQEAEEYTRYFPRPVGMLRGEWTPRYLSDFWVPAQLAVAAPRAKVLVMVRDPVDRYLSGVRHGLAAGVLDGPTLASEAVSRGYYGRQLEGLYRHIPRGQVLVLQYERCLREPLDQLRRTYEFLGLDPYVPQDLARPVNVSRGESLKLPSEMKVDLVVRYADDVALLQRLVPDLDLSLWPNFSHRAAATPGRSGLD